MKAIVQDKYGPPEEVLYLKEIAKPVAGDNEVLVRVRAASVHADVWHVVAGRPRVIRLFGLGVFKPKHPVPGTDLAGLVESVGKNVTQFKIGDEVFGDSHGGIQWHNGGAFAEYAAVPQDNLAIKPTGITFEQAASLPTSGFIALHNLQGVGKLKPGHHVLINGAAGGVGSIAVQLAKAFGARVTAVDNTSKLEMLRTLGADHVIDYTREDFTRGAERYDLIMDVASTLEIAAWRRALKPTGMYVRIGHDHYGRVGSPTFGSLPGFFALVARSAFDSQLPALDFTIPSKKDTIAVLKEMLEAGKLTPIIDRTYPLSEAAEAMRYLQSGQSRGRIIIIP